MWIATLTAFLLTTAGCGGTHLRPMDEEIARKGTGLRRDEGQRIDGYVLSGGIGHEYEGRASLAGTDSLALWTEGHPIPLRVPGPVFPLASVEALEVVESSNVILIGAVGLVVGAAAAYAIWAGPTDLKGLGGSWSLTK